MIYLLDSDIFSLAYHKRADVTERIAKIANPDTVVIGSITRVEALKGRLDFVLKASNGTEVLRALD